jgi:hypothetical protein
VATKAFVPAALALEDVRKDLEDGVVTGDVVR